MCLLRVPAGAPGAARNQPQHRKGLLAHGDANVCGRGRPFEQQRWCSDKDENFNVPRVQVPNNWVLGFWVIVIIVQVLGKFMIIRYLDP